MQRNETLLFWDAYHEQETAKEWILVPSQYVLDRIVEQIVPQVHPRLLEIGCGTSRLALELFHRTGGGDFVVTDVSEVCIAANRQRDEESLTKQKEGCRFEYRVLNVLEPPNKDDDDDIPNQSLSLSWDVVLDKGCLDTLLYRSRHQEHAQLLTTLLNNVHGWLQQRGGRYLVLTPRARVPLLRDYPGFSSVQRTVLQESLGDLDGKDKNNNNKRTKVYMHVCCVDPSYQPTRTTSSGQKDESMSSQQEGERNVEDDDTCPHCGLSFFNFREGEYLRGKGLKYWTRRWNGHQIHCRG